MKPLFETSEWTFELIEKLWHEIDIIGKEMGLDYYPPQIEIVSAEQMLDNYSSHGMPSMYSHWSFGKSFIKDQNEYISGKSYLAYELVINSNPSIAYLMESNSATMQALVLAHASVGHSSFFKSNYLFKQWTDAEYIIEYLQFAKSYIADCEEKYGEDKVSELLDACHALRYQSFDKYKRPPKIKKEVLKQKERELDDHEEKTFNDLWRTVPDSFKALLDQIKKDTQEILGTDRKEDMQLNHRQLPEENILYFLEKYSLVLKPWQREVLRIVRKITQYFYPNIQTKLMNEGWASFVHHEIMTRMHDKGLITEGSYIEFLCSHCNVIYQPKMSIRQNPYALGIAIFQDLKRIILDPDEEDMLWFPDIAGKKDYLTILFDIVKNYRDESFILQWMSPKVMRKFKFLNLHSTENSNYYLVTHTHSDEDYKAIRKQLSEEYAILNMFPQIEICDVELEDNTLMLQHTVYDGNILDYDSAKKVHAYIEYLWGGPVQLDYVDTEGNEVTRSTVDDYDF